jgi:hypothetical protein
MIRPILELLIQRSLDEGTPLPRWLAALVLRDRKLRQFVDEFQTLDDALLLSAAARRDVLAENQEHVVMAPQLDALVDADPTAELPRADSHPRLAWAFCSAVAATLLVGLFATRFPQQQEDATRAQVLSRHLTAVPDEMLVLLTLAADTSQSQLSRYTPTSMLSSSQFSAWQAKASRIAEPLDRNAQLASTWLSKYSDLGQRVRSQLQEGRLLNHLFRNDDG